MTKYIFNYLGKNPLMGYDYTVKYEGVTYTYTQYFRDADLAFETIVKFIQRCKLELDERKSKWRN